MYRIHRVIAAISVICSVSAFAQQSSQSQWFWGAKFELRGNYRNSDHERFQTKFKFAGNIFAVEETVNPGNHAELSVAQTKLDLGYGKWFLEIGRAHV